MKSITAAVRMLPLDHYIQLSVELDANGNRFLSCFVFQLCPEGGWAKLLGRQESTRFEDRPLLGVSSSIDDPDAFERLVVKEIERRWPS